MGGTLLDVGGQAVLEGVMMRGPRSMVIAVRRPDRAIVVKDDTWVPLVDRASFLKWPLLRGATVMVEALINGMQALTFSASVAVEEPAADGGGGGGAAPGKPPAALTQGAIAVSLAMSLLFGVALFIYLPHAVATLVFNLVRGLPLLTEAPVDEPLFHVVAGTVKMAVFVAYILLIRRMNDIRRVFQYHGAEHKSIHAWEAGQELTVENARRFPTYHPRCGTSFLVFVILISIGFFAAAFPILKPLIFPASLVGWKLTLAQATVKIPLMIPIAGLSYEFIKWAGRRKGSAWAAVLGLPGRAVQKLTTIEPDDDQLEVALVSLQRALEREGALARPAYSNCVWWTPDGGAALQAARA